MIGTSLLSSLGPESQTLEAPSILEATFWGVAAHTVRSVYPFNHLKF